MYLTADPHFFHELVMDIRGFSDIESYNDAIVSSIFDPLPNNAALFILGDLTLNSPEKSFKLLTDAATKKNVTMHYIIGNHDEVHPMHRHAARKQKKWLEVFESVQPFGTLRMNKEKVLLSHFPYEGDHTNENRYLQFRLPDRGRKLVHGHTHQTTPTDPARLNQVCVSWDAWKRSVHLAEVYSKFAEVSSDMEPEPAPDPKIQKRKEELNNLSRGVPLNSPEPHLKKPSRTPNISDAQLHAFLGKVFKDL